MNTRSQDAVDYSCGLEMKLRQVSLILVIFSGVFAIDLFEFPMNLAGFMSIERASDACVDRINEVRDSIGIPELHQIQQI